MSFKVLTEQIVAQHHSLLRRELPYLSQLVKELAEQTSEGSSLGEAEKLCNKIRTNIETHLRDEETLLFPTGIALEEGRIPPASDMDLLARLQEMEQEHENCGKGLQLLSQMISAQPESEARNKTLSTLQSIIADMDVHVEKENTQVHPHFLELMKNAPATH